MMPCLLLPKYLVPTARVEPGRVKQGQQQYWVEGLEEVLDDEDCLPCRPLVCEMCLVEVKKGRHCRKLAFQCTFFQLQSWDLLD